MIQITIVKITGYGPWTLTLGSDREHEIQMLQASLYLQIQKLFSDKNGLVFRIDPTSFLRLQTELHWKII